MALMKLCRCGKIIPQGIRYCEVCEKRQEHYVRDRNRHYNKHKRDKEINEFYNSSEWLTIREYVLAKYKGLDLYAYFILKKIVYADTVHHIEEVKDNWERRLDIENLIPLSGGVHNTIHGLYKKDKKAVQLLLLRLIKRWEKDMGRGY